MTTATRKIAQIVCKETGRGHMIFNDRLVDGTRSLKVWGWRQAEYKAAKALLESIGCKATLVEEDKYSARAGRSFTMRRLHVQE
jgi:hypothetical protein